MDHPGGSKRSRSAATPLLPPSTSCFSLPFSHSHQHHIVLFPFLFFSLCISAGLSWWIWVSGCLGESATFSGGNWSTPTQRWVSWCKEFPEETSTTFYCHSLSLKAAPTPELCTTWYACFKISCILNHSFTITVTRLLWHLLESDATKLILSKSKCSRCQQNLHPPSSVMSVFEVVYLFIFWIYLIARLFWWMQRCHRTVFLFICVHPPSHQTSGLPRPVLLCPPSVSLSLMSSLRPSPLSLL